MPGRAGDTKTCLSCGRHMQWRKSWERNWDEVRYCSAACRKSKVTDTDRALEDAILALLEQRSSGASICPSEAARVVGGDDWRELIEPARRAARRLVTVDKVEITQKGQVVDPSFAKGPIRIRKVLR
jgi:hypothetical protein